MRTRGSGTTRIRRTAFAAGLAALLCADPPSAAPSDTLPLEPPVVTLDRVVPRSGNNPFDPRDPLAPVAGRAP